MFLHEILAVFQKEMIDSMRDRRSILSGLSFAVFGPLLVVLMLGAVADRQRADGPLEIPLIGAERAPALVEWLEQQNARIVSAPADYERALRDGELDFVVEIDSEYGDHYRQLRPAVVRVAYDSSRLGGSSKRRRVVRFIQGWGSEVAQLRLLARGIDPSITQAIRIEQRDHASEQARGAQVLGSLPMFFLLSAFICGMNVAIDTTAGERERGSLETLLAHGVASISLAVGKWATAVAFNVLGVVVTVLVSLLLLRPERFEGLGVAVRFGPAEALGVLVIMLPVALLAPALQMSVAIFSRNFKEAQTYLSLLIFVPMVPGFLLLAEAIEVQPWMHWMPVFGQQLQLLDLMRGDTVGSGQFFAGALGTLALAFAFVVLVGRLLDRERIVLAR